MGVVYKKWKPPIITDGRTDQILQHPTDDGEGFAAFFQILNEVIIHKSGYRPVNADHIYEFDRYINEFPHPPPRGIGHDCSGTLLWTGTAFSAFINGLPGWNDIHEQDVPRYMNIFKHYPQSDVRNMYKHIMRELGRSPTVREFGRLLPILEGNEVNDSSRKTPGQLLIELEESKRNTQWQRSQNNLLERELLSVYIDLNDLQRKNRNLKMCLFLGLGLVCVIVICLILTLYLESSS
ncbi:uncharacterized protein LOC133190600 [Saccostrea echinata]|uniref:uncharacterized protein LOC133190600 n=1 Tax=Saccostrea echinata TaxID=191078 RepID=UPI002A82DAA9|nr:uncharacterized protein LOC133190600 [Saccostrea echinata]